MLVILIEETAEQKAVQSAAVLPIKKIADDKFKFCRWLNFILPMANKKFAVGKLLHLPMANVSFADGKLKICNRQVRRWPSAKFMSDKWQM